MFFYERKYQLYIILGSPKCASLWARQGWSSIEQSLLATLNLIPGQKSMQSLQYDSAGAISLGRIGLNKKGLEKWIHDKALYPNRNAWSFHSNEIWAPGRTECGKLNLPPDLYFGFVNQCNYKAPEKLSFNPYIVLAGALDRGEAFDAAVASFASVLIERTFAVYHYSKQATWGRVTGLSSSFSNAIGDLLVSSIFKPGNSHADLPFPERISDYWQA